jgi:hypothetical protein
MIDLVVGAIIHVDATAFGIMTADGEIVIANKTARRVIGRAVVIAETTATGILRIEAVPPTIPETESGRHCARASGDRR